VTAGDSKTDCIYAALGTALSDAETATGVTFNCISAYATGTSSWTAWEQPWVGAPSSGYAAWLGTDPGQRTLVLALDLVPSNEDANADWRGQCAQGQFASYATALGGYLVSAGLGDAVVRLAPEMDGSWVADNIGTTAGEWNNWAICFQKTAAAMKAVAGAHFLFDWNVNAGYEVIPPADYYPGNAYVDIVGVDAYDESPIQLPPVGSPKRWPVLTEEPLGLDQLDAFAVAHHKPLSIPEWGTLSTHGDDGAYVAAMGHFVATHDVAYQSWYDAGDNHIFTLGAGAPKTLAAYVKAFGPHSVVARDQRAFALRGA